MEKSQLYSTKCTKFLSEEVAPAFFNTLKQDSRGKPFALRTDESTDTMIAKHLCNMILY